MHKKLSAASELVNRAVDVSKSDPKLAEIKTAFQELKLSEIQVDVTSPQLLFNEDLAVLRKAVGSGGGGGGGGGEDSERVASLEQENTNLRELLQQAKIELLSKGGGGGGVDAATVQKEIDSVKKEWEKKLVDKVCSCMRACVSSPFIDNVHPLLPLVG